jgi:dihydrolipoamide dehydrogenase
MRANVADIYAIGDITGKMQLAHVAAAQGEIAAANCAGRKDKMSYDIVPACIYTSPEIAYVGKGEKRLKESGADFKTGVFRLTGNGRSIIMGETNGLVKIFSDAASGAVLGAQIFAHRATDMIAGVAAVMKCGGTVRQLAETIHPHPSVSEIMMEAANDTWGMSINSPPAQKQEY